MIRLGLAILLAASSADRETPYFAAMLESVSPDLTMWMSGRGAIEAAALATGVAVVVMLGVGAGVGDGLAGVEAVAVAVAGGPEVAGAVDAAIPGVAGGAEAPAPDPCVASPANQTPMITPTAQTSTRSGRRTAPVARRASDRPEAVGRELLTDDGAGREVLSVTTGGVGWTRSTAVGGR